MKTPQEREKISERTIPLTKESGVFVGMNFIFSLQFLSQDYVWYVSRGGKWDMFFFLKQKIRLMQTSEDFERAFQYGFTGLMIYEQELVRVYEKITSDKEITLERKRHILSWILSNLRTREIEWITLFWKHREKIEPLFVYWEREFLEILKSYNEIKSQDSIEITTTSLVDSSEEEIYRILSGQ